MARTLNYSTIVSLDGFTAGPGGWIDWPIIDAEFHTFVNERFAQNDIAIFGRRMYETMRSWDDVDPHGKDPEFIREFARVWRDVEKRVHSTTLDKVGPGAKLVRGLDPTGVAALKDGKGGNLTVGGATLAAAFARLGLIDGYEMFVAPVLLGDGLPMFHWPQQTRLELIETRRFKSGAVHMRYKVIGPLTG